MEQQVERWQWNHEIKDQAFDEFEKKVDSIKSCLKEVISINKFAISFYKRVVDPNVDWDLWKNYGDVYYIDDFTLKVEDEAFELQLYQIKQNLDWNFELINEINQQDLIPKETLVIKKDIKKFLHDCLSSKQESIKFDKLIVKDFILELQNKESNVVIKSLRQIPAEIEIPKESGQLYLDEALSEIIPLEQVIINDKIEMINKFQFDIDVLEIESISKLNINIPIYWNFDYSIDIKNYSDSLNSFILDESLEKGSIYKINTPFMKNEPTFKESLDAFEFSMIKFMPINECKLIELNLKNLLNIKNESDYINEEINLEPLHSLEYEDFGFDIIREEEVFLIEPFELPIEKLESVEPELIEPEPTEDNDSEIEILDSNIEIDKSKQEKTRNNTALDSIIATRMDTFVDERKRSLDDELNEIMSKKRKKPIKNVLDLSVLSLLKNDIIEDESSEVESSIEEIIEQEIDLKLINCKNSIIINSSKLNNNLKILNHMKSQFKLNIIEYELNENEPDFIINSDIGILVLNSNLIFQINENGKFKYEDIIVENNFKYNKLIIFIIINDSFNSFNQLLNFQLITSLLKINSIILNSFHEISLEITKLSFSLGKVLNSEEIKSIDNSSEISFLHSCGINPFLSIKILNSMKFSAFIKSSYEQRSKFINSKFNSHLQDLFNIEWNLY